MHEPTHITLATLRERLAPDLREGRLHLGLDDLGNIVLFMRLDLTHLDADALNDRLAAWTKRRLNRVLDGADAHVSFRHARPSNTDPAELDVQEKWLDLEATFRLEMDRPRATKDDVETFASLVPEFEAEVAKEGRPTGWRVVDEGNAE